MFIKLEVVVIKPSYFFSNNPKILSNNQKKNRFHKIKCTKKEKKQDRAAKLREEIKNPKIAIMPSCHDALTSKLIEDAGFDYAFMSSFTTSAAKAAFPDTGLLSYTEMVEAGRYIHESTQHLSILGDADNGYGNAINVKRTVKGYIDAGFAGILLEDQVTPKSCGHVKNKKVYSRKEAVQRVRAACDIRDEYKDIVIVARTDSRQAESLEEAIWRVSAFADAGADMVFIDALESKNEMMEFCKAAKGTPKLANMLEGGGKTPILELKELEEIGFKLVVYPLSLLGVYINAVNEALEGLKMGKIPELNFEYIKKVVGFERYYREEERYK